MLALYYAPGSAAIAPQAVMEELGLDYELRLLDRATRAQKAPDYLALNPSGRIPTLIDGDLTLFETGFGLADQGRFEREIEGASRILFLHDNAGEAAIDQLLISELRSLDKDVDVVVRGAGLFHDATRDDVPPTGLIIETESEVMGAPPVLCSTLFNEALERADLVIAKGSASWQTLPPSLPLVTLLTPKCEVMAAALGIKSGRPAMVFADG